MASKCFQYLSAPRAPEPTPKHDVEAPILTGGILDPPPGVLNV